MFRNWREQWGRGGWREGARNEAHSPASAVLAGECEHEEEYPPECGGVQRVAQEDESSSEEQIGGVPGPRDHVEVKKREASIGKGRHALEGMGMEWHGRRVR